MWSFSWKPLSVLTPLKHRKISKQGLFFQGINFKFQYGQLFWGLSAKYCPCFLFQNNKTHVATFIFVTKFSFKLTSSSKWFIGSIRVQISGGFSCNEFHFLLLKGQMNQKIEIFSFVALPSADTKKNHPKWDLGKDFLPKPLEKDKRSKSKHFWRLHENVNKR